ncbi:penicillin-binding protein, 1A family [Frateuria aurantia DSM 6220]|uniref:Penicillin-binding protein 1A n=2 Tax=Frateuria aurantia TaxID=81475 RepID=H8L081_FRAAD|nr:penicillin-binding protein, 1A family [Frateuria aurantia DSM 6220]
MLTRIVDEKAAGKLMQIFKRLLRWALVLGLTAVVLVAGAIGTAYWLIAPKLPDVATLRDYHMQVPLKVLSADGKLIASFGEMRRIPVSIEQVPDRLKHAVLSAEDGNFYNHPGVDWHGIVRAAMHVILSGGDKGSGGSTITQQVARNFFLSPEKLYSRKLTEIFIALQMEHELSKDEILSLYLNKMFLGHRSYGVAAAAEYYYGKHLDQLTNAQAAMIAGTFQLPSLVNPLNSPHRALARRNWVLGEMHRNHYLSDAEYQEAIAEPNDAYPHEQSIQTDAPYMAEMVRQQVLNLLGNDAFNEGYVVKTTLDSQRQSAANKAVWSGLHIYDMRHGWRGPEGHHELPAGGDEHALDAILSSYPPIADMTGGIVTASSAGSADIYMGDGHHTTLNLADVSWARPYINDSRVGPAPSSVSQVLKPGDIIRLVPTDAGHWKLSQIPDAQSALVSLRPEDGAVQALVGGFSFARSKFNRAVMAARQPGSSFKPYIYSAAFERGFNTASIVNDAPVVLPDASRPDGTWTPSNDDDKFSGPIRLRQALVESKNLVSVRLLSAIGVGYARQYLTRFGFRLDVLPNNLSMALGTASVSPMTMAQGYAVFANGGYLIKPYYITEIDNRDGQPVYVARPPRTCMDCQARLLTNTVPAPPPADFASQPVLDKVPADPLAVAASTARPVPAAAASSASSGATAVDPQTPVLAPHVIDIRNDWLITSMMKDVILNGTGRAAKVLNRADLAGKTGSTNDHRDAWFAGFNGDLVTTVWVGFDNFNSLGRGEFGARAALPIWIDYMGAALKGLPLNSLPMPPGISTVMINRDTGLPASPGDPNAIPEQFKIEDVDRLRNQANQQQEDPQQHSYDIF